MPKNIADLPTNPETIDEEANLFFEDRDESSANAILILSQLDPTSLNPAGAPVFNEAQQRLIMEAGTLVSEWSN